MKWFFGITVLILLLVNAVLLVERSGFNEKSRAIQAESAEMRERLSKAISELDQSNAYRRSFKVDSIVEDTERIIDLHSLASGVDDIEPWGFDPNSLYRVTFNNGRRFLRASTKEDFEAASSLLLDQHK